MAEDLDIMTPERGVAELPPAEGGKLIDLLIVLARYKRFIAAATLGGTLVAAIVSLLLPNVYRSTAVIMAPEPHIPAAALLTGLPLWGWGGMDAWSFSDPNEKYVSMLYGETIGRRLVERFQLQQRYDTSTMIVTLKVLRRRTKAVSERTGVLTISYEDTDAHFAADVANAYVEEFQRLVSSMIGGGAQERRVYFEKELASARDLLTAAEAGLAETQKRTGLIVPAVQSEVLVRSIAQVRAEITLRESQLRQMRTYATEQNSEVIALRQQIAAFRSELGRLEGSNAGERVAIAGLKSEEGLEFLRKAREVAYYEMLVELLAKQVEGARVDEKTPAAVPVVDRAYPADRKHKPYRAVIVAFTFILVGFLSMLGAIAHDSFQRAQQEREFALKMRRLKRELYGRNSTRLDPDA